MASGASREPLQASERVPAVLAQDASASVILHPPDSSVADTEPQGANQSCCSLTPTPKQTRPRTTQVGRWAGGQEAPWRRSGGSAANPARGAVSGWLRGDCGGKQRQGGREGPGKVASVVARVAALREVAAAAPVSRAQHLGEEGRGGESGPSLGSWCPGQGPGDSARKAGEQPSWPTLGQPEMQAGWLEKHPGRVTGGPLVRTLEKNPLAMTPHDLRLLGALPPPAQPPNPQPLRRAPPPQPPGAAAPSGTCPRLGSGPQRPTQHSGVEVFGSHSWAFCPSFPQCNSELSYSKGQRTGYLPP